MTTRYIHPLNRSQPNMLSIARSQTAGSGSGGGAGAARAARPAPRRPACPRPSPASPNLAPIAEGPFYAVPVQPGDIGTKGGLVTDGDGRVLREDAAAVEGLYASGNCSAAVMGETYPGPGATIGPAMAFSWAAVNAIARDREGGAGQDSLPS
ncbi:FAD-binding protein [Streptomyces sp. NPDC002033]|uniref:FAD-binding protein n=1 Tax=unclassified Streptomyces TaxID=2593676 RepID=UPI0033258F65